MFSSEIISSQTKNIFKLYQSPYSTNNDIEYVERIR